MTDDKPMGKREAKRVTKDKLNGLFAEQGCELVERSAGAVNYMGVRVQDSKQNCAAIYGSKNRACSVWMKEDAFDALKAAGVLNPEVQVVEDVSMFRRGFQWSVHVNGPEDPIIPHIVEVCVSAGIERWTKTSARKEIEARRDSERADREARMAEKRRNPWA
jgi:hypothetical protein|tara:strand:- start:771 stop:1256 length:486 start_codon:yes stop_codon:yes gene_type:complete